ncbi:hypothetical protein RNP76_03975, partial [Escherichia coli]|nr:hypothetical protein [Escherichia coli]
ADRNRSHWSTSKTPSYTKSVSWQHHPITDNKRSGYISLEFLPEILKEIIKAIKKLFGFLEQCERNNAPVLICMDCGYYERI